MSTRDYEFSLSAEMSKFPVNHGREFRKLINNSAMNGEVVVAQLVERSLLIPEVRGSTPVIGKILLSICLLSTVLKRQK